MVVKTATLKTRITLPPPTHTHQINMAKRTSGRTTLKPTTKAAFI